jgi:cobalt-zinc-cadmium efflux system membrane fusion protein
MKTTALLLAALAAALAGCGDPGAKNAVPQPRIEGASVTFPAGSPQLSSIVSEKVEPRTEAVVRFNGRLVWDENRTARVFSPFAGRVQSIAVQPGTAVRAGQVLAWVAAPDLGQAQSDARRAEQDNALARKQLARMEELHGAGVAALKDLQSAQADAERTAAERARTTERLKLYGAAAGEVDQRFALRAPVSGIVVERNLNPGQEVRPDATDKALFVVSDPAHLWFMLDASEADVGVLKPGMKIRLSGSTPEAERFDGEVTQVSDFVDPLTRTVKVRGVVDNDARKLKAEMYVIARARVPTTEGLIVSSKAVYLRGEQYYVFVDAGGGRYTRKPVRLGQGGNGHQVVMDGLEKGEKVVIEGNLMLERLVASKD